MVGDEDAAHGFRRIRHQPVHHSDGPTRSGDDVPKGVALSVRAVEQPHGLRTRRLHPVRDAVLVRFLAGGNGGPHAGREERVMGHERTVRAVLREAREVGHPPGLDQGRDQAGARAVDADQQDAALLGGLASRTAHDERERGTGRRNARRRRRSCMGAPRSLTAWEGSAPGPRSGRRRFSAAPASGPGSERDAAGPGRVARALRAARTPRQSAGQSHGRCRAAGP
jgi:hypothetical protein